MKRILPLLLLAFSATAGAATLDTAQFGKSVALAIPAGAVSADLADFPVLVRLSTAGGFLFGDFAAPGDGLRFATADGENLDYEIDTWDAAAGDALVWVSLPVVPAAGTNFVAYFAPDASYALPAVSPTAVWTKAGYLGVWHFSPASGGVYANSAQPSRYATPSAAATERTGGAVGGYVQFPNGATTFVNDSIAWADDTPHMALEFWVDRQNKGDARVFGSGSDYTKGASVYMSGYISGNGGHSHQHGSLIPASGWRHVAVNFSGTAQANALADGATAFTFSRQGGQSIDGNNTHFFHNANDGSAYADFHALSLTSHGNGSETFKGYADEFRLRGVNSDAAWMKACYDTQAQGSSFLSVGAVRAANARIEAGAAEVVSVGWSEATISVSFSVAASVTAPVPVSFVLSPADGTAVATPIDASSPNSVATLTGLAPNTAYTGYFAVDDNGASVYSPAVSFTTSRPPAPDVADATWTGATVSGAFAVPGDPASVAASVLLAPAGGSETAVALAGTFADGVFAVTNAVGDLLPGTAYTARFSVVRDGGAAVEGATSSFSTPALPAPAVSGVSDDGATATAAFSIPRSEVYAAAAAVFSRTYGEPWSTNVAAGGFSAELNTPIATVTGLDMDTDYTVWLVLTLADGTTVRTPKTRFSTTGSVPLDPASYRKSLPFRVSGYEGASTLTNFPALVRLSAATSGFSYADVHDPAELRFAAGGARLEHEVESWDPDGESLVWVSIPRLRPLAETNTYFTMFYKPKADADVPAAPAAARVWTKAGYVGVWHLAGKEEGAFPDSTGLAGPTAAYEGDPVAAEVGNGATGTGELVVNSAAVRAWDFRETGATFEAWLVPSDYSWSRLFENGNNNDSFGFSVSPTLFITAEWAGSPGRWSNAQNAFRSWVNPDATALRHLALSYGTNAAACAWYEDGRGTAFSYLYNAYVDQGFGVSFPNGIGLASYLNGTQALGQTMDEIRVRAAPTPADWGAANWKTMARGQAFVSVDRPEPVSIAAEGVAANAATIAGAIYAPQGASVAVRYATVAGTTNVTAAAAVTAGVAAPASIPLAKLLSATEYTAWFVVDGVDFPETAASFTTDGFAPLDKSRFSRMYTFGVSTNLPAGIELPNFPVPVRVSTNRLERFSYSMCAPDGSDVRFADSFGNSLPMEVENWNTNGESIVWVNVPVLSRRTHFTMHCGVRDASRPLTSAMTGYLWTRAGYRGVWHMARAEGFVLHGSVPGMDGTASGAQNAPTDAPVVDGGTSYAPPVGPYQRGGPGVCVPLSQMGAAVTNALATNGGTAEFWVYPSSFGRLLAHGTGATNGGHALVDTGAYYHLYGSRSWGGSHTQYPWPAGVSGWRHAQFVWGREGADEGAVYVNGAAASGNKAAFWQWGSSCTSFGVAGLGDYKGNVPQCPLDELRLREGVSTPEWALAVYLSMADPDFVVGGFNPATILLLR